MLGRGRLTVALLLGAGFASGWWASQQVAASMARPLESLDPQPAEVSAPGKDGGGEPAPAAAFAGTGDPAPAPAAVGPVESRLAGIPPHEPGSSGAPSPLPPAPPRVPDEVLRRLPPSARGTEVATAPGGRVVERVAVSSEAADFQGPLEVEYTLDPWLNERVAEILRRDRVELGHVIVLDPSDGRVLAYVSTNPSLFPATRVYPMASLMKVVTAAAVLQHRPGVVDRPCHFTGNPYYLSARLLDPPRAGHIATFEHALATSNNQCFAQFAVNELGAESVIAELGRLGVLEAPAPGHAAGEIDPVATRLELGELGSGLAGTRIAPLTAVRLAAALAEGQLVTPQWIARVTDASGAPLALPEAQSPRAALDPRTTGWLRGMLVETTENGTARRGFNPGGRSLLAPIRVAGKTGSLNGTDPEGRYEWFIGVAPADAPRVAVVTLIVNRGVWRRSAAQLAAEVLHDIFCADGVCREGARQSARRNEGRGAG